MPDEATADLIFASDQANHNFARVLGDLRRSHLSIAHRLRSIRRDAAFVAFVAEQYPGFALVANERCGSWYIPSAGKDAASMKSLKTGSAYFKSTDGHTGQWSFSMRRLNLHLVPLICGQADTLGSGKGKGGGCILVDSTRRGKRMPDALSKTIPLWCCVLNRALFAASLDDDNNEKTERSQRAKNVQTLYTPPGVVSASENSQMLSRVPAFVEGLLRLGVLGPDVAAWRRKNLPNDKPLRPVWITPDMPSPDVESLRDRFNVVLCCTSSHVPSANDSDNISADAVDGYSADYIQGAADDTENWAHGLTPEIYWSHCEELLATSEADLPEVITSLVNAAATHTPADSSGTAAHPFTEIAISPYLSAGQWTGAEAPPPLLLDTHSTTTSICRIVFVRKTSDAESWVKGPNHLEVGLGKQDKIAGRTLRYALPKICEFAAAFLARCIDKKTPASIRVLCSTGRDIAVGTALALLCYCFDEAGGPRTAEKSPLASATFNKDAIRVRLGRIMTAMPHANPSRTTLQSVNSFLMDLPR